MNAAKHHVTIKGVKDGLIFLMDDTCPFDELLNELEHKLSKTHQQFLSGPLIHVQIKLGKRYVGDEDKERLRERFASCGNLLIQSIDSEVALQTEAAASSLSVMKGMIRSGQIVNYEGSVMLLGDINPGGTLTATGDIYVLGALRGSAHAGTKGNKEAIIAASQLCPTQLRIAEVISRPPDEWGVGTLYMEFAYVRDDVMEIEKIQHLQRLRPHSLVVGQ
ncbi:septum site-determining protein MinC [Paenibacillus sp. MBLB4367]|uniref:septum site-determining protein MinC n=1 Tax=Paenibacillus sp. MBLB4367 TaxID=3384767 RepID=UPI003907F402